MTSETGKADQEAMTPRDAAYWANPVDQMQVAEVPAEAINLNVQGRKALSPLQGFGQMWQKTYRVRLSGADCTPQEVVKTWKARFPEFWPEGNRFYGPLTGIAPGEVAVLNVSVPGGMKLSTGVRVIYADDESFTFMTPEGHMFAGWITFSAFSEDEACVAQAQALIRANDPIYEIAMRIGFLGKNEDQFWQQTLENLAAHYGVDGYVQQQSTCVDPRMQWAEARNIWYNAGIRSALHMLGAPVRWVSGQGRKQAG
jgi:hypothetical protein